MGIPVQRLEDYDGTPTPRVKVGTHFRIKGLEFKVVFLPCLGAGEFPRKRAPGQDLAEYEEERSRSISQLYVAMTRARDGLFLLCSGDLSKVLDASADRFELLDT
jgi:superfamily I DNA/RNA helicase